MVATFSPHRDAGGTLHLSSHSGIHHIDANTAIRQLRRSFSRSPSKSSSFSLLASRNQSPSKNTSYVSSPLSPSRRSAQGNFVLFPSSQQSPFAIPYPPSAKITRPTMRRTRTSPRSPVKRALNVSTDQGNAKSSHGLPVTPGVENSAETPEISPSPDGMSDGVGTCPKDSHPSAEDALPNARPSASRIEKRRSGNFGPFTAVSPMKRSDGIMNLDRASRGSPSAKRRSVQAPNVTGDFSIFDSENVTGSPEDPKAVEPDLEKDAIFFPNTTTPPFSPFATVPRRTSSLRRSTLQQRQSDRSLFSRARAMEDSEASDVGSPLTVRSRPSLNSNTFQPNRDNHENLFSPRPTQSSSLFSNTNGASSRPAAHPLSRTITQSSSSSSLGDDSPTHEPPQKGDRPRAIFNFSKSLPANATRPHAARHLTREDSTSSTDSFATPENYKLVKPLPAAFMSTGLISKKNRNVDDPQSMLGLSKNMPDTPCKRPVNLFTTGQRPEPEESFRNSRLGDSGNMPPPSPFNPPSARPKPGPFARGMGIFGNSFNQPDTSRRGSLASLDGEEGYGLQTQSPSNRQGSQPLSESDFPPTPTKQSFFPSRTYPPNVSQIASLERLSEARGTNSSPLHDRFQRGSPRTPQEHFLPPDPSGLTISAPNDRQSVQQDFNPLNLPATPTGPRESFIGKRPSLPLNTHHTPDVDPSLTSRFERVELVGTGEFSQVYRVSQPNEIPLSSIFSTTPKSPKELPRQIWAVKKAKQPYSGLKDRERRIREVDALKALTNYDHIISFTDSWENHGHLYIQTEYCEEGSLDVFLAQVGLKARLDDFRIWKILLELSTVIQLYILRHCKNANFS